MDNNACLQENLCSATKKKKSLIFSDQMPRYHKCRCVSQYSPTQSKRHPLDDFSTAVSNRIILRDRIAMPCVRSPFSVPKEKENYKSAPNLGVYCSIICLSVWFLVVVQSFISSLSSPKVSSPSSTSSRTVAPSIPVTCCALPCGCGCPCIGGGGGGGACG